MDLGCAPRWLTPLVPRLIALQGAGAAAAGAGGVRGVGMTRAEAERRVLQLKSNWARVRTAAVRRTPVAVLRSANLTSVRLLVLAVLRELQPQLVARGSETWVSERRERRTQTPRAADPGRGCSSGGAPRRWSGAVRRRLARCGDE